VRSVSKTLAREVPEKRDQGIGLNGSVHRCHVHAPQVTSAPNGYVKQSSLEALGYICEEIEPDVLAPQSNLILTAVVQGMRKASYMLHAINVYELVLLRMLWRHAAVEPHPDGGGAGHAQGEIDSIIIR